MATVSDWARVIGVTIVNHLREEELAVFRRFKVWSMLENSGNILMNQSGRGFDWNVRYRLPPVAGYSGDTPRSFARQALWKRAELPYRGASVQDSIFRREMLENRGQQALVNVASGMAQRLQESMQEYLAFQIYADGNAAGQENNMHGLESFAAVSGTIDETNAGVASVRSTGNTADRYGYPSDTYAGLSTQLGAYGGGRISATGRFPEAPVDPEFDFYSPLVVNYNGTNWGNVTGKGSWKINCVDAVRAGIHHCKRNDTKESQIDMVVLDRSLYIAYLKALDGKERINVENTGLRALGFTDTFQQDGVSVTSEYAVPAGKGYGISIGNMSLHCLESSLLNAEGPFYDEELSSYRYSCSVLANLKLRSPRNFFVLAPVTAEVL